MENNIEAIHIHTGGFGNNGPVLFLINSTSTSESSLKFTVTATQLNNLRDGLWYINVHTDAIPTGEIRGQFMVDESDPYGNDSLDFNYLK